LALFIWQQEEQQVCKICADEMLVPLLLWREALAPSKYQGIFMIPRYWMEDRESRWDELGRCGVRQWTWDVPEPLVPEIDRVEDG